MRPLWKGTISFGLVSVPIKMYTATENKNVKFRYLHDQCKAPVEYQRVCSACGKELSPEEIVRGYEYEKGRFVVLEDEDFDSIDQKSKNTIDILEFVDLADIDPVYYDKTYYLSPEDTGLKPYQLLKQVLSEKEKVAIARVVIRSKESLACIRVLQSVLAMETMYFPDEIRNPQHVLSPVEEPEVSEKELEMAGQLVEGLAAPFSPEKFKDQYRESLLEIIQAKIAGDEVATPKATTDDKIVSLVEALEKSVDLLEKSG